MNHATIHLSFALDAVTKDWIDSLALPGTIWTTAEKTPMQQIGENISLEIRKAGYRTIVEFARSAGINPSTLNKVLAGKSSPRLSTIKQIADGLGKQVNELLVIPGAGPKSATTRSQFGKSRLEVSIEMPLGSDLPVWLKLALEERGTRL